MVSTPAPPLDPTITDVLIPSAAILVSAAIAFAVIGLQLVAAKRERRSQAIGNLAAAVSHIISEGSRRRRGEDVDLEVAMAGFDAAVIQLTLAVPRRDRLTVEVIRDRMYTEHVSTTPDMEVKGWQVRHEIESWALGQIPNREFRAFAAWSGHGPNSQRYLYQAWDELRIRMAEDPYISPEELAAVDRRLRRAAVGRRVRIDNWLQSMWLRVHRR